MITFVNNAVSSITMYRLMLYFLFVLFVVTIVFSFFKLLPYNPLDILLTGCLLAIVCHGTNFILARFFHARPNLESASITALILTLIVGPLDFEKNLLVLSCIGVMAMASKYVLTIRNKHIFNPAAIGIFLSAFIFQIGASWWIGSIYTLPFVILGGLLILIKIKRFALVLSFLTVFLCLMLLSQNLSLSFLLASSFWFFAFVMLVEPLTSPTKKNLQIAFGALVAVSYFALEKLLSGFSYSFEASLLIGNLFAALVSPTATILLTLKKKEKVARDTYSFYFEPMSKLSFLPGQFLELTYPHKNPDSRGVRRYFSIASSPQEKDVMITLKVIEKSSTFKKALQAMKDGEQLTMTSPQGEFVLPKDTTLPLAFIAGGIGITPFHSMIESLLKENETRDVVLLYTNSTEEDVAFNELLEKAKKVGIRTISFITEKEGHVTAVTLTEKIPDYGKRAFYISGPQPMVDAFKQMLGELKVVSIKTDFFPGYTK